MRVGVEVQWDNQGQLRVVDGKLMFPSVPEGPGIYRFTLQSEQGKSIYIGEADRLKRRFTQYRNPGPSQETNQRINARMKAVIEAGGRVEVAIATRVRADVEGHAVVVDLLSHPYRLLAENAALVIAIQSGETLENL